jgi:[ribosomal protein S5]-alanine N-acetyltransferase
VTLNHSKPLDLDSIEVTPDRIRTPRLELVLGTTDILRADLEGPDVLASALGCRVPAEGWPPGEWDADAVRWMLDIIESGRGPGGWGAWYYLRSADRLLVGAGGFKGGPDASRTVEIGYSVVESVQRQGIATEAALGLTAYAFADPAVTRVIAETLPHLVASLGVMRNLGFVPVEPASEPGVVRYGIDRPRH